MPTPKGLIIALVALAAWALTIGLLVPGPLDEVAVALITYYAVGRRM